MSVTQLPVRPTPEAKAEVAPSNTTASFATLPVWKANSTAAEWLSEVAALALENPQRFARVIVVAEEFRPETTLPVKSRLYSWHHDHNTGIVGTLQVAQLELFDYMKDRQ